MPDDDLTSPEAPDVDPDAESSAETTAEPVRDLPGALAEVVTAIGGDTRPGQLEMAQAVAATLAGGPHLLVQAGTGTGKSVAYLVPSLLSGRRVVIATATLALQHQLVARDLPRVAKALAPRLGRTPRFAVLKGRTHYVCREKLARGSAEEPDPDEVLFEPAPTTALGRQAVALRQWAESTETGDRDDLDEAVDARVWRGVSVTSRECVGATACPMGQECFAEAARARAAEADVVVTNHAMLAIATLESVPVLPPHDGVVVDEGHELVDRATSAVTAELSAAMVQKAASRARRLVDADLVGDLDDAADGLADELAVRAAGGGGRLEKVEGTLVSALAALRDACHAVSGALGSKAGSGDDPDAGAAKQRARAAVDEVHDVAGKLLTLTELDVAWLEGGDEGAGAGAGAGSGGGFGGRLRAPVLKVAPLSVAGLLRTALFDTTPVVVTSATLTLGGSFDATAAALGLADDPHGWSGLDVGSPFDHAAQGILYVARHLPPPGREGVPEEALDELAQLVEAAGGRSLVLLSSWRGVARAADHLRVWFDASPSGTATGVATAGVRKGKPRIPLLVQQRGDSVADLVKRFAAEPRSVLLGTMSLWQGVDVPGESCTLVVIDRIPFPRPDDPLLSARAARVDAAGGNGFMAVSVPRAALLLAQGAGRLIRSRQDRGVVAVLDPRLATARYGGYLRASLPDFWATTDPTVVRAALTRLDAAAVDG